ncbi:MULTISPECIES: phosphatase PAP2 family protein [Arenibacter]|uniref:phosphatase PAP2 family protein n=1 Tax=Arenibacter TaxID=178469 RepID=UPI001EFDD31A|nr:MULTISPECIES: phosphatase PAP2 family protein [Arenibacter]
MKFIRLVFLASMCTMCVVTPVMAQQSSHDSIAFSNKYKFKYPSIIVPASLIAYGIVGIESDGLKLVNSGVKEEVNEHIDQKITIDNFSQYAPGLSVYGLNMLGVKGEHDFWDRTIILATSYVIMSSSTLGLKAITKVKRPDGSSLNSFPSGHTATAFMGAEFLYQEYKSVSPWIGVAGYLVATGTGMFRVYNDRHWITDVVAGAGIGILSTKIAYWLMPYFQNKLFKREREKTTTAMLVPFYSKEAFGLSFTTAF